MNKLEELKDLGYDIQSIINSTKDQRVLKSFYNLYGSDITLSDWTEEDKERFIDKAYNIIMRGR